MFFGQFVQTGGPASARQHRLAFLLDLGDYGRVLTCIDGERPAQRIVADLFHSAAMRSTLLSSKLR